MSRSSAIPTHRHSAMRAAAAVFSYADVMRVLKNADGAFSRDLSPWLPKGPHHMALDFMLGCASRSRSRARAGGMTTCAASWNRGSRPVPSATWRPSSAS